ncbi:TcpE family conjugal transfer membrane protein [Carnobacterium divergens]|uniref:TcpE family conjugal transfer membrane protein n=1 Tax=Carnobacterium divergens TaxID=2748 RepID=UPI0039AEA0FC
MSRNRERFNYKEVFEEKIKFKQLTKYFVLPEFVVLADLVTFVIVAFLLALFLRKPISWIGGIVPGGSWLIYLGVPYLVTVNLGKLIPDGKKVHQYLFDLVLFYVNVVIPKRKYCQDRVVEVVEEPVVYEKIE